MHLAMNSLSVEPGRRVILVLTDGSDTCVLRIRNDRLIERRVPSARRPSGCIPIATVQRQANDDGFMVYGVGMQGKLGAVADLAAQTGGGHFILERGAELSTTFRRVVDELLDGKTHNLEVQVQRPGMTVRSRKSYLAVRR
jgi:hypothetical protein